MKKETPIKIYYKGIIYTVSLESVMKSLKKRYSYGKKPRSKQNNIWNKIKKELK